MNDIEDAEKKNPLGNPPRFISEEEQEQMVRDGGYGGKGLDVPTRMRNEVNNTERLNNLPIHTPPAADSLPKN